jgi:hypothetical protein
MAIWYDTKRADPRHPPGPKGQAQYPYRERLEQARDDQGQRQIPPALRRPTGQQGVDRDAARGAQCGEHVAVR